MGAQSARPGETVLAGEQRTTDNVIVTGLMAIPNPAPVGGRPEDHILRCTPDQPRAVLAQLLESNMRHIITICLFFVALLTMVGAVVAHIDPTPTSPDAILLLGCAVLVLLVAIAHDQIERAA